MNDTQILLYTSYLHVIGGIETFVINFIDLLKEDYSIGLYCPKIDGEMENEIGKRVKVFTDNEPIKCDTLVMIRVMEEIPENVIYKKSIRMCHACKSCPQWHVRDDCDSTVHVSEASRNSFNSKGDVIHNPLIKSPRKALMLVSATRIPAPDKGKNAQRMLKLAEMLSDADIPFLWYNFSDAPLQNAPKGFINVGTYHDLQPYIAKADYLVQLSDQEGFGYSVLEALINETAVICTGFETTKELGVIDKVNGYIIPFDMNFDVRKLLQIPTFCYEWDNSEIKSKWKKLFGKRTMKSNYKPVKLTKIRALRDYYDTKCGRAIKEGDIYEVSETRAAEITKAGYARRIISE